MYSNKFNIQLYSEFNDEIKTIWTKFEKRVKISPFQSYDWLCHWHNTIGEPLLYIKPKIIHIYNENQTVAIFPLGITKKYNIRILNWLGGNQSDYMKPLISNEFNEINFSDNYLWEKIKLAFDGCDLIEFQKQDESTIKILKRIGFPIKEKFDVSSYQASLPLDWEDYLIKIKKKIISDSKRQKRRLSNIGKLKFAVANDKETKKEFIAKMINYKNRQYNDSSVWNMFTLDEYRLFYNNLVDLDSEIIKIHSSALIIDNVIIATHLGLIHDNIFYYLMPSHIGGKWKKYSPGRILLLELIKWSIANNVKSFDFTIGNEGYKKDWCDKNIKLYKTINSISVQGWLYNFLRKIKGRLAKLLSNWI